jgi:hypothetical protein
MSEITLADIKVPGKDLISLSKLAGPLADIHGYIDDPHGGDVLFIVTRVIFANGSEAFCEPGHDMTYLVPNQSGSNTCPRNMDDKTMKKLYDEGKS